MTIESEPDRRELFVRERTRFITAVNTAISVSKCAAGRMPKPNIVMASYVFTRMCIAADTLLHLLQRDVGQSKDLTLDHYSIGVIARTIVESALMFHYLSEDGVSDESWALRRGVLNLHDVVLKLRLFKSIGAEGQYKVYKTMMEKMRNELKYITAFKSIDAERQQKMLSGHELYVGGLRSTLKLVGFEDVYFDGMYAYLSSQVHIAPSSFYFTEKRLSFDQPTSYQYYFAAYGVAHARMFLSRSATRLAESDDAVRQKIDPAMYDSIRELARIPFGD